MTEIVRADHEELTGFTTLMTATLTDLPDLVSAYQRARTAYVEAPNFVAGLTGGSTLTDRGGAVDTARDALARIDRRPGVYGQLLHDLDRDADGALSDLEAPSSDYLDAYIEEVVTNGPPSAEWYEEQAMAMAGMGSEDDWQDAIDRGDYDDAQAYILASYEWYQDQAVAHPELLWLVMANTVSPFFYKSMLTLENGRQAASMAADASEWTNPAGKAWDVVGLDSLAERVLPDSLDGLASGNMTQEAFEQLAGEQKELNMLFMQMQKNIFLDMAPAHLAYLTGGQAEVERLIDDGGLEDPGGYLRDGFGWQAWGDALEAHGDAAGAEKARIEASGHLLRREQGPTIVDQWDAVREDHGLASLALRHLGNSPIPHGESFHDDRPNGDPTRASQRTDWGLNEMTDDFLDFRDDPGFDEWQDRDFESRADDADIANGPL